MHPHSRLWLLNIPYIASGLFFSNVDSHLPLISLAECNNQHGHRHLKYIKEHTGTRSKLGGLEGKEDGDRERLNGGGKSTSICKNCEHQQRTCERGWVWGEGRGQEGFKVSKQTNISSSLQEESLFSYLPGNGMRSNASDRGPIVIPQWYFTTQPKCNERAPSAPL